MSMRISKVALVTVFITLGSMSQAAKPPASIPMMSMDHVAQQGFFYAGGEYVGEGDQITMGGAMYVEVMVPQAIRHPSPLVFLHRAGQTGGHLEAVSRRVL